MVPVASWVRVWSMRIPISPPLFHSPSTRWASRIFRVRLLPMCPPRANKAYYARRIYRRAWLIIGRMPRRLSIAFLVLALCSEGKLDLHQHRALHLLARQHSALGRQRRHTLQRPAPDPRPRYDPGDRRRRGLADELFL